MNARFNWKLPLYGALGAVIIVLPKIVSGNQIGTFLFSVPVAGLTILFLLITAVRTLRSQCLAALLMLAVFCAASLLLFRASDAMRTTGRWLAQSKRYKAAVLTQPSLNGDLRHVEWDGWGFAGTGDTTEYLVFDPEDSLAGAAKSHSSGRFSGIPCEVPEVRRLESEWYTVRFYTDTVWDRCN